MTNQQMTLGEDWRIRRDRLAFASEPLLFRAESQIKVLEFLLQRYQGTEIEARPARFCLHSNESWNNRLIAVHQHLGRGVVAGVKNQAEADQRIKSILQRMSSTSDREPDSTDPCESVQTVALSAASLATWKRVVRALKKGLRADKTFEEAIDAFPIPPQLAMQHLCDRLSDMTTCDYAAMELLCRCDNSKSVDYAARAWRKRTANVKLRDRIVTELEIFLCQFDRRKIASEKMRQSLADENSNTRIAAAKMLERIGDLDDVGLFSDLLSLPESEFNPPREGNAERNGLVHAMQMISERENA